MHRENPSSYHVPPSYRIIPTIYVRPTVTALSPAAGMRYGCATPDRSTIDPGKTFLPRFALPHAAADTRYAADIASPPMHKKAPHPPIFCPDSAQNLPLVMACLPWCLLFGPMLGEDAAVALYRAPTPVSQIDHHQRSIASAGSNLHAIRSVDKDGGGGPAASDPKRYGLRNKAVMDLHGGGYHPEARTTKQTERIFVTLDSGEGARRYRRWVKREPYHRLSGALDHYRW